MSKNVSLSASQRGLLALLVGALAVGFAPIFVRVSEVGPSATAFWRLALALPVLFLWSRSTPRRVARSTATAPQKTAPSASAHWLAVVAGLCFAGDLVVWHRSIHFTTVANATLLTNLSVVFVPLLVWALYRKRVSRRFALAIVVALGGTVLLVGKNAQLSAQTLQGDALAIVSALFYSGYIITVQAALQRGMNTARIMLESGLITAVAILPLALAAQEVIVPPSLYGWGVLLCLAIVSHVAGQSLIAFALAKLPAALVSLGLLLQPATATLVAWLWLGESLSAMQIIGAVILIIGIRLAKQQTPAANADVNTDADVNAPPPDANSQNADSPERVGISTGQQQ